MLVKGDKIKLIRQMGCFNNIGEVCEIVNISEDAIISFKFGGIHLGCMSYNEFEKYFVKVENIKRDWTKWESKKVGYYNINGDFVNVDVEFRHNGLRVQVRCGKLKARSSCHKNDIFDTYKGFKIASSRIIVKMLSDEVEEMAKSL